MHSISSNLAFALLAFIVSVGYPSVSQAKNIWVAKHGSDGNNCSDAGENSCLTIQKGISIAEPGDIINISEGVYVEDSEKSSHTEKCTWMDDIYASLCTNISGNALNPITLQAAEGHKGRVIIDSEGKRVGLHTMNNDFWRVKGLIFANNHTIGIASWGQVHNAVPDENLLGVGLIIEENIILNTKGRSGMNVSGIGMWGSKDWIVRNNVIKGVSAEGSTVASGIQSYGVINALVENNDISDVGFGIFWKDHYVKDEAQRGTWFESEIRFNKIKAKNTGVLFGIRGAGSPEAGENYVHHNVIYGMEDNGFGIRSAMTGALGISSPIRIENNLIDGRDKKTTSVSIAGNESASLKGNIFVRNDIDSELIADSSNKVVKLTYSDFNVFDSSIQIIADRYSNETSAKFYRSLSDWKSVEIGDTLTVATSGPDKSSIVSSIEDLFSSISSNDYVYNNDSLALKIMADGLNAGPYENGGEVIGVHPELDIRPAPPLTIE